MKYIKSLEWILSRIMEIKPDYSVTNLLKDIQIGGVPKKIQLQCLFIHLFELDSFCPEIILWVHVILETPGYNLEGHGYVMILVNHVLSLTSEQLLEADICGMLKKICKKNAEISNYDMESFISISYKFDMHSKCEILQALINNKPEFNLFYCTNLSVLNDPDFTPILIPNSFFQDPTILLSVISTIRRLDIKMLKLIRHILRIGTPSRLVKKSLIIKLESMNLSKLVNFHYELPITTLQGIQRIIIDQEITSKEKKELFQIHNEVLTILYTNDVPTLIELSRNAVRKFLVGEYKYCTTNTFIDNLKKCNFPREVEDIVRCKKLIDSS